MPFHMDDNPANAMPLSQPVGNILPLICNTSIEKFTGKETPIAYGIVNMQSSAMYINTFYAIKICVFHTSQTYVKCDYLSINSASRISVTEKTVQVGWKYGYWGYCPVLLSSVRQKVTGYINRRNDPTSYSSQCIFDHFIVFFFWYIFISLTI